MKKIIVFLGILATILNSCSNYIEEDSKSFVPADETYKTADGFQLLVNTNYAWLKEIYGGEPWLFCAGTDMYAEGRTAEPAGLSQYKLLIPSSTGVEQLYNSCYKLIQSVNKTMYYSTLTEQNSNVNTLVGEARFLRANAYFLLVQTYGGVPIVDDHVTSAVLSFERNTAEEVYEKIISDLEFSLANVSTSAYTGKINKRAVQDLLAKVYLTRGYETFAKPTDFTTAASYADSAIAGQALTIAFDQLVKPGNDMNAETIFSVQYDKVSTSVSPTKLGNSQFYYFSSYLGGSETKGGAPLRSYNLCPTDYALGLYTKDDKRWDATFMTTVYENYYDFFRKSSQTSTMKIKHFYEPSWFTAQDRADWQAANESRWQKDSNVENGYHNWGTYSAEYVEVKNLDYTSIPVKKFDDPDLTTPAGTSTNNLVSTRDIVVSRLGETYLVAAEAYLKAGNTSTGLARLNEVRKRAGVVNALSSEFNIDYILDERGRELLGEYHRWFDLKRTGTLVARASLYHPKIKKLSNPFVGVDGALKILRPIPQLSLDLNQNKDFPQNPGY